MPEEKMNKINVSVERQRSLKPELALIIYSEGPNMYGHEREKEIIQFMVTANGKFINPKALDMRSMQDIFNSAGKNSTLEYLDDRILAVNNTGVVWYEPSRKAEIFFDCPEDDREDLNALCKGKKVWWPSLLFRLDHGSLFCRALAEDRRPNPESKLYIAPFTHINAESGRVCLPQGLRFDPAQSMLENMRCFSEDFYLGIFGHGTAGNLTSHPGGHDGLWREILKSSRQKRFPNRYLLETRDTLQNFLR